MRQTRDSTGIVLAGKFFLKVKIEQGLVHQVSMMDTE